MEKVNLLRKAFEGEYEPISHFITNRSEKYISLYKQSSKNRTSLWCGLFYGNK